MMKKIITSLLVLALTLSLAPAVFAAQTLGKPVTGTVTFNYVVSAEKGEDYTGLFLGTQTTEYDDNWFLGSACEYNHNLAIGSLCATMTAVSYDTTGTGNMPDGDRVVTKYLKDIGCEADAIYAHRYKENASYDDITAVAFGVKSLPGTDKYLVVVLPRNSGYGGEWASDMRIYDPDYDEHSAGFRKAAEYAYERLEEYLAFLHDTYGIEKTDVKLWITGFSRGAAVSNNLGQILDEKGEIAPENIFVYDYAVPLTVRKGQEGDYPNIFNVCSEIDVVTRVPLVEWDYTRYGTTFYLPCLTSSAEAYLSLLPTVKKNFSEIMTAAGLPEITYNPLPYQEKALDLLLSYLTDAIETPEKLISEGWQDILVNIMKSTHSYDENTQSILEVLLYAVMPDLELVPDVLDFFGGLLLRTPYQNYTESMKLLTKLDIHRTLMAAGRDKELLETVIGLVRNLRQNILTSIFTGGQNDNTKYYNTMFATIIGIVFKSVDSALLMQHWPESYLSWMRAGEENELFADEIHDIVPVQKPTTVGDVNGDGKVNLRDMSLLNGYLFSLRRVSIDKKAADIDGNGRINARDSIRLAKLLVI